MEDQNLSCNRGSSDLSWNSYDQARDFLQAGRTPLHLASLQGHSTLASLLIGRGAAVDPKDEYHMTPLHKAAIKVQLQCLPSGDKERSQDVGGALRLY